MTSESKYSEAVEVALGRSRLASLSIAAAGGATLGMLLATPMPWWAHGALSVAVGASVVGALRSVAHCKGRRGVRELRLDRSGRIEVRDAVGCVRAGRVRDRSFVAPWLTLVRWRPEGARFDRTVVILPDALVGEDFRRLRVLLRWGGGGR